MAWFVARENRSFYVHKDRYSKIIRVGIVFLVKETAGRPDFPITVPRLRSRTQSADFSEMRNVQEGPARAGKTLKEQESDKETNKNECLRWLG